MPGLTLFASNRLEVLAQELADRLRRPGDPLQTDIIIVQSRGMARWLSLAIARRNGIAANCRFPFPQAFIDTLFADLFDYDPAEDPFEPGVLTFMVMRELPALVANDPAFDDLRTYLQNDSRGLKKFQLAAEIADLLDQYLIFRPDMLLAWERHPPPKREDPFPWQRILWKTLTRKDPFRHRASLWRDLVRGAIERDGAAPRLPGHVSLFGVSYLPPYYLQVLESLGGVMAIDIYQLNPCREYWADITSDREMDRIRQQLTQSDRPAETNALHLEIGNRLLASMGGHGREFHALLADLDCPLEERFEDVSPDTMLKAVQHDLLNLTDRGGNEGEGARLTGGAAPDSSIQVHACHGPMREIEVLHDQLLALLHHHPDLEPRDILVLTPDIECYAPYIQAVFGSQTDERLHLPFSIADRPLEGASPLVEAFDRLLGLRASRFTRSEILALLEFGPLREHFDISETDLVLITEWTDQVRIRWGLDGASKTVWDLPAVDANTWRDGLDRLFLGYAMRSETERLFQNVLPDDCVQGSQIVVLGRLSTLIESLAQLSRELDRPRTWDRWHHRLNQALSDFFRRNERFEYDFQVLERLLGEMQRGSAVSRMHEPVDLDVVKAYLRRRLRQESYRGGFIGGGITFGALLPMRSIPAAIICLVGMNHDNFPRLDRPRSFDLMALNPRLGDRSRRSDDRYLFLETLISARRCVYISYTGFDVHDNAAHPPSVLVSELLDYLQEGFGLAEDDLVTIHRLQAFSPAYFKPGGERLFSFNRDHARSARNLAAPSKIAPDAVTFLSSALEPCSAQLWSLTPEDLRDALGHPCRFLMENRLDLKMRGADSPEGDREAFALSGLEKYQEGQWLTQKMLEGLPSEAALPLAQACGVLPHGEAGRAVFRQLADDVASFSSRIRSYVDSPLPASQEFQLALDGFRLSGRLENLSPGGPLIYRYTRARGRALLEAWIQHLVFCSLESPTKTGGSTVLVCRDEVRRFADVANSRVLLVQLLDLYFQAVHTLLPLFPQSSLAFARQRFEKHTSRTQAMRAAQRAWEGSFKVPGDMDDPYIALGFRGRDPWTEDFEDLATQLYEPLFAHSETLTDS